MADDILDQLKAVDSKLIPYTWEDWADDEIRVYVGIKTEMFALPVYTVLSDMNEPNVITATKMRIKNKSKFPMEGSCEPVLEDFVIFDADEYWEDEEVEVDWEAFKRAVERDLADIWWAVKWFENNYVTPWSACYDRLRQLGFKSEPKSEYSDETRLTLDSESEDLHIRVTGPRGLWYADDSALIIEEEDVSWGLSVVSDDRTAWQQYIWDLSKLDSTLEKLLS